MPGMGRELRRWVREGGRRLTVWPTRPPRLLLTEARSSECGQLSGEAGSSGRRQF